MHIALLNKFFKNGSSIFDLRIQRENATFRFGYGIQDLTCLHIGRGDIAVYNRLKVRGVVLKHDNLNGHGV